MDIKRGQKVWVWRDRCRKSEVIETAVKSVGPKYITTELDDRIKYYKDTLREVNGVGYGSYIILDIDEYRTKQRYSSIALKLHRTDWEKVDRDKLDEIAKILNLED